MFRDNKLASIGIALLGVVYLAGELGYNPYLLVGSIKLYSYDLLAIGYYACAGIVIIKRPRLAWIQLIYILLIALSMFQFTVGLYRYGTQAGVEFRQTAFTLGATLFLLIVSRKYSRRHFAILLSIYVTFVIIVYMGRMASVIGPSDFDIRYNVGTFREQRYIGSDDAYCIYALALLHFSYGLNKSKGRISIKCLAIALFLFILAYITMHRSVWIVGIFGMLIYPYLDAKYRMLRRGIGVVFFGGWLILIIIVAGLYYMSPSIQSAVDELSQSDSSLVWRTEGWQGLVPMMKNMDWIMGKGYGADRTRSVLGQAINNSWHNFYIEKIWQMGAIGLSGYIILYAYILLGLKKIARSGYNHDQRELAIILMSLISGELIYYLSYSNWIPDIFICGYAFGYVLKCSQEYLDKEKGDSKVFRISSFAEKVKEISNNKVALKRA